MSARRTAGECPAGCGRIQQPGKFLCSACWSEVPRELQREVYAAWRVLRPLRNQQFPPVLEFRAAVNRYRAAREAALAAIA